MIFVNNYQKLLIFQSNNIWRYLVIFNDIWRYMTTENCRTKNIVKHPDFVLWETNFKTKYNELRKIKDFLIILLKLEFFDKVINVYWMRFMAINAVTDLKDYLFYLISFSLCKSSICSFHLSVYQIIKNHVACWDGYLSSN